MGLPPGADLGLGELEGDDVRDVAHPGPPPVDHLVQPRVPDLGTEQVDDDGRDMGPRFVGVVVAVVLDPDVPHEAPPLRLKGGELLAHLADRPAHALHDLLRPGERGPLGKEQPRFDDVALDVGERPELELSAHHHRERDEQQGHDEAEGQVAPRDRPVDEAADEPLGEAGEPRIEPGAEAAPRRAPLRGPERPHQVVWQDEERLDEAERQGEDQDDRQDPEHRPDVPLEERERAEHRDGGEEGGEHPRRHLLRSGDRRIERREPGVAMPGDVLRDHDRVVHQQADRDQQAHHGDIMSKE